MITTDAGETVPRRLRVAAAYGWRILVIAAVLGLGVWLVIQLKLLVVPLLVSILVTALLWPIFSWMTRHRFPKWLAIVVSAVGAIVVIGSLFWLVIWQVSREWSSLQSRSVEAMDQFRQYLIDGPLGLTPQQIDDLLAQGWDFVQAQAELLWSGALAIGTTVGHVATGAVLSVFILLCLLADGAGIWRWTTKLFPKQARPAVDGAAHAGWVTVVTYARTQLLVATIDAVGIGLGAFFLGVPMAIPIAVLVFFGAFVPIVGAVVTGTLGGLPRARLQRSMDRPVDADRRPGRSADRGAHPAAAADGIRRQGAPARRRARGRRRRHDRRHPRCPVRRSDRRVHQRRRRLSELARLGDRRVATRRSDLGHRPATRRNRP